MESVDVLFSNIISDNKDNLFYSFINQAGKKWIIPAYNMVTAMNIYQPSSVKGKILKLFFPVFNKIRFLSFFLKVKSIRFALNSELNDLLCHLFNTNKIEYAFFCGTPSIHQKITLQISHNNDILGYCKISDNKDIEELFKHENVMLSFLREKGLYNIPQSLYVGEIIDDINVFVQTTVKTQRSIIPHQWEKVHNDFLIELHNKTKQNLYFENTDFYDDISYLYEHIYQLKGFNVDGIRNGLINVLSYYMGKEVSFSVYHSDFTPWNMFIEKDKLFVFDFEYAKYTYPAFLDYFHFFIQTSIFERHYHVNKIYQKYLNKKDHLKVFFENPDIAITCYLLSIISFNVRRDKGNYSKDILSCLSIWNTLLSLINNDNFKI